MIPVKAEGPSSEASPVCQKRKGQHVDLTAEEHDEQRATRPAKRQRTAAGKESARQSITGRDVQHTVGTSGKTGVRTSNHSGATSNRPSCTATRDTLPTTSSDIFEIPSSPPPSPEASGSAERRRARQQMAQSQMVTNPSPGQVAHPSAQRHTATAGKPDLASSVVSASPLHGFPLMHC